VDWGIFLGWKPLLIISVIFIALFSVAFPDLARWIAHQIWNWLAGL